MIKRITLALGLSLSLSVSLMSMTSISAAATISMEEKVALQAGMFQHIETISLDGMMPHVELEDGSLVNLVVNKAHPMILAFGDNYVLCSDFRDPDGKAVNLDFYMTKKDGKYVVFQTEVNNRGKLEALMKNGKVSMAE